MGNVYKSLLFEYTVTKKEPLYGLNVKRVANGQSFGRGRELLFTRERMCELLYELGLPEDFIKICMFE